MLRNTNMSLKYFSESFFLKSRLSLLKKISYSDIQFHYKITYCILYLNNLSLPRTCIACLFWSHTQLQVLADISGWGVSRSCFLCSYVCPIQYHGPSLLLSAPAPLREVSAKYSPLYEAPRKHLSSFLWPNIRWVSPGHKHPLLQLHHHCCPNASEALPPRGSSEPKPHEAPCPFMLLSIYISKYYT